MKLKESKQVYNFAGFTLTFNNLSVPFLSENAKKLISEMSFDRAKEVNKEAWKQKKTATRMANKHCNWSQSGNIGIYESSAQHARVAELVCKETYKRMMKN